MVLSQDAFTPEDTGDVWSYLWLSQLRGMGTTPGIQWIDAKEATKHPARTSSPTAKGDAAQSVCRAEVNKPCPDPGIEKWASH